MISIEKIRVLNVEYEIISIKQSGNFLTIEFPQPTDLSGKNLSTIELLTAGGIKCADIIGFKNIYKVNGNIVTLSKEKVTYIPDPVEPGEPVEPGPSALDIKLEEIDKNLVYTELALTEIYEIMLGGTL